MGKRKTLRSRCGNEDCRKMFRHADRAAAFCSSACRQRVYRIRHKAKKEAVLSAKYEQILAALHRKREAERQAVEPSKRNVEEERRPSQPEPAAPEPRRRYAVSAFSGAPDDTPWVVTIRKPRRAPMTPLGRGRR